MFADEQNQQNKTSCGSDNPAAPPLFSPYLSDVLAKRKWDERLHMIISHILEHCARLRRGLDNQWMIPIGLQQWQWR